MNYLTAGRADKHKLYETSVQSADTEVEFMDRVFVERFGRTPQYLREDFCGTALMCKEWVEKRESNHAIGIDLDESTLQWAKENNLNPIGAAAQRVSLICDNVLNVTDPSTEIIAATNFSWWGFHDRKVLKQYFLSSLNSLVDQGMLMLDIFGGPEAQVVQFEEREYDGFTYIWDQDKFNPITHSYKCNIHFRFPDDSKMENAFQYDWRIWTIPETRDLLLESGFKEVVIYWEGTDQDGNPNGNFQPCGAGDLAPAWVAYIVAFK
ncbi:class I SAM-dependent methyltransferase [bacterium]|jgi:hypothetical protein|nr:class I SAM-dependent methyltransferase [bacterium]